MEVACSSQSSITGYGDSASTLASHSSAIKCYEKYRLTCNLPELASISREVFCTEEFFQKFAFYLTDVYKTKYVECLKLGTALSYIGCLLIHGETKLFKGRLHCSVQHCSIFLCYIKVLHVSNYRRSLLLDRPRNGKLVYKDAIRHGEKNY